MGKTLNNKPLAEAIFELRWGNKSMPGQYIDPNYQILLGRLYDYFKDDGYVFHETLAASEMPPMMTGHKVQHRFRVGENVWPLVQVGQGILTVNDIENYNWDDFYSRCIKAINGLYNNYPGDFDEIPKQLISLKYIDAYDFDYAEDDLPNFFKEKMSLDLRLPDKLIGNAGASGNPKVFSSDFIYDIPKPKGVIRFRLANGVRGSTKSEVIVWETEVRSDEADMPINNIDDFSVWLTDAHTVTSEWFFGLIKGDLEKEFK